MSAPEPAPAKKSFFHSMKKAVTQMTAATSPTDTDFTLAKTEFDQLINYLTDLKAQCVFYDRSIKNLGVASCQCADSFNKILGDLPRPNSHSELLLAMTNSHQSINQSINKKSSPFTSCLNLIDKELSNYQSINQRITQRNEMREEYVYYSQKYEDLLLERKSRKKPEKASETEKISRNFTKMTQIREQYLVFDQTLLSDLQMICAAKLSAFGPVLKSFCVAEKQFASELSRALSGTTDGLINQSVKQSSAADVYASMAKVSPSHATNQSIDQSLNDPTFHSATPTNGTTNGVTHIRLDSNSMNQSIDQSINQSVDNPWLDAAIVSSPKSTAGTATVKQSDGQMLDGSKHLSVNPSPHSDLSDDGNPFTQPSPANQSVNQSYVDPFLGLESPSATQSSDQSNNQFNPFVQLETRLSSPPIEIESLDEQSLDQSFDHSANDQTIQKPVEQSNPVSHDRPLDQSMLGDSLKQAEQITAVTTLTATLVKHDDQPVDQTSKNVDQSITRITDPSIEQPSLSEEQSVQHINLDQHSHKSVDQSENVPVELSDPFDEQT